MDTHDGNFSIHLNNLYDTERLGLAIGNSARAGDCICLNGHLGAGKTTLTQAIALGLEVPAHCYVTSPSFAIMQEYYGRIPLYHMDFYRLTDSNDVIDLGFEEYFYLDGLTVIEWAERAIDILPESRVVIEIKSAVDGVRTAFFCIEDALVASRYQAVKYACLTRT